MNKIYLTLGIALLTVGTWAQAEAVNLTCVTDPYTTSFVVFTNPTNHTVTIRVIHHNGTRYMPINSTQAITPNDLPHMQQVASALTQLGDQYDLIVKDENCHLKNDLINCYAEINQTIRGHKISWVELESWRSTIETPDLRTPFRQLRMDLSLNVDDADYNFSYGYDLDSCTHSASALR